MSKPNMNCGECPYWLAYGEPETTDEQKRAIKEHCRKCAFDFDPVGAETLDKMMRAARQQVVLRKAIHDEGLGFGEGHISESPEMPDEDKELAIAAQEAHDNLIRSLVEAGGEIREARELLTRSLEWLYILGYDSSFTNPAIDTLTTDIKKFLEDTQSNGTR